ncbi:MAG: hypothetical protein HW386_524 [Gammaproteobacteria bacterium]|nr:hypothetical protein [Gammaproteobacteria bacterium]
MNQTMNTCIVELNDCEIRVANDDQIILRSPGVAVLDKEDLHVGEAAVKKAFLNPRTTFNRYWHKLNQDALPVATRHFRHHADLVYNHLLKIHQQSGSPQALLFAVPGSYSGEQLSMLLGIAAACPFSAVGLVDAAVAGTAAIAATGEYQHIDIHLHQTVITRLNVADNVTRTAVETVAEYGLHKIYSAVAGLIADLFIQQSRFDPLHHAVTEQSLYDQLPACLQALRSGREMQLEIRHRDRTHQAKLPRDVLLHKLQPVYAQIREHISPALPCLVGDRLAALPGFTDTLPDYTVIDSEAVFKSCRKFATQIHSPGPELSFITSLPAQQTITVSKPAPLKPRPDQPATENVTHILYRHQAYPIGDGTIYLSGAGHVTNRKPEDAACSVALNQIGVAVLTVLSTVQVSINGRPVNKTGQLQPGDRVQCGKGGVDYEFIRVLNAHGSPQT